ncbi:MAG: hypothetical protein WAU45_05325 [Blastocatellia bacterium]
MRTRLLLAAVCILTLPLWFPTPGNKPGNAAPLATVAYAGHTTTGDWCECGGLGCIPNAGELCGNNNARAADDQGVPTDSAAGSDVDPGAGLLMFALAFFLWTRLRT